MSFGNISHAICLKSFESSEISQTEILFLTQNAYCDISFASKPQGKTSFEVLTSKTRIIWWTTYRVR